jgi:cytochrome P450
VIMEQLGVPDADRDQVRLWMDHSLDRIEEPPYIPQHAIDAMGNAVGYWSSLVSGKRAHPDAALASRLCEVEMVDDDGTPTRLTDEEIVGFLMLIGAAGTETVMKLLANAVVLFQRNPDEWQKVLADPTSIPGAVEEVLRYWAPSQFQGRVLTDEVALHDVTMAEGSRVLLVTGSANRDERTYDDPDRFDIERPGHVALGLGHGVHFCLGASLARLESKIALEEFAARFPNYEVDETKLERVHQSNVHGFSHAPFVTAR